MQGLQAEHVEMEEADLSADAPEQLTQLEPNSSPFGLPEHPSRSEARSRFFISMSSIIARLLTLLEMKVGRAVELIAQGRRQLQAWLDARRADRGQ